MWGTKRVERSIQVRKPWRPSVWKWRIQCATRGRISTGMS